MMNPIVIETLARLSREESMRRAEQYRWLNTLHPRRKVNWRQVIKSTIQAIHFTAPRLEVGRSAESKDMTPC